MSNAILWYISAQDVDDEHVMVFFQCLPGEAECLNDGIGPALTYRQDGSPICTCLCPKQYNSPMCEYPSATIEMVNVKMIQPSNTIES